jgi:hypothetical protein
MVAYGFGTSQTVLGMISDLLLGHKATKVILEIKAPKAIRVSRVMMEHLGLLVPKVILVKLVRKEIRDYQVKLANEANKVYQVKLVRRASRVFQERRASRVFQERRVIKDCLENLDSKVSKAFQDSKVSKAFRVSQDRACPLVEH